MTEHHDKGSFKRKHFIRTPGFKSSRVHPWPSSQAWQPVGRHGIGAVAGSLQVRTATPKVALEGEERGKGEGRGGRKRGERKERRERRRWRGKEVGGEN